MKKLKRIIIMLLALTFMLFAALSLAACPNDSGEDNIIDKFKYALVEVTCGSQVGSGFIYYFDKSDEPEESSVTANETTKNAIIVTNYHIIKDGVANSTVDVRFFGESKAVGCTVLGYSREYDIAVLSAGGAPKTSTEISSWGNGTLGEKVYALAYNGSLSAFDGMVSNSARHVKIIDFDTNLYLTETTAASPFGSSGGPCISESGRFIGLNAYNITVGGILMGVSYKIPASIVSAICSAIIDGEKTPNAVALPFIIHSNGTIVVTCFDETFEVTPVAGGLTVTNSKYIRIPSGSIIRSVNGVSAEIPIFLSELINTGRNTELG